VGPLQRARADLDRMQVKPDIADDVGRAVARRVLPDASAPDAAPDLRINDLFLQLVKRRQLEAWRRRRWSGGCGVGHLCVERQEIGFLLAKAGPVLEHGLV